MPAISVIMVFHRDTAFLRPAIASVLAQTWRDFELVLVDNGTGLSAAALGPAGADPRIRWVRLARNEGISRGTNAGIAAARGEFIALLDYDDLMAPPRLERQLAQLRTRPHIAVLGAGALTIDETGRTIGREFCLVGEAAHHSFSAWAAGSITPSWIGRTHVFREFGYRPEFRCAGDYDFIARVTERYAVDAVPEMLAFYRRHRGQATKQGGVHARELCLARLLASRRRAGRDENYAAIAAELEHDAGSDSAALHDAFGARFCAEGFIGQAIYEGRRMIVANREPRNLAAALRLATRCLIADPVRAPFLLRLFLTGPVRALGLRDAGRTFAVPTAQAASRT